MYFIPVASKQCSITRVVTGVSVLNLKEEVIFKYVEEHQFEHRTLWNTQSFYFHELKEPLIFTLCRLSCK